MSEKRQGVEVDLRDAPVDPVDPAWWRDVLAAHPESGIALASLRLGEASLAAASMDARAVLSLLALVTSAMLDPDDWNDPFKPIAVSQGRRSAIPSDLDADQLDLLRRIAEAMDSSDAPALRARVSDICWTYGNRGDAAMLTQAIDSYSSVPLEPDQWYRDGRSEWKRGLGLVKRRGRSALNQLDVMADTLRRRLDAGTSADGFFGVELSATTRNYGLAGRSDAETLAKLCVGRAGDADDAGNLMLQRGWEEEATAWYAMADRRSDAYAAQVRIAHSFASEAQARRDGGGGQAMAAAHFVELALKVLTALPRTYRAEHGLDDLISQLRQLLQEDRQRIIDGMVSIKSDPIDISNLVETARRKVSDLEKIEALVALGSVHTWMPFEAAIQQAESSMASHPLLSLFGNETFSGTGQKVASRPGISPASAGGNDSETAIDPAVWATAVRDRTALFGLVVSGLILPALEVVATQHRYPIELLYEVCRNSPLVPHGHELVWAHGLRHGLNNDFASAACILVPQIEHLVRTHLRQNGVHTLVTDDNGVETEKGLAPLLEDPKTAEVLGRDLVFELQALLTQQEGTNLRNTIAHGLVSDHDLFSDPSVCAWWLALRLATLPFAEQDQHQMAKPGGVDPGG